MTEVIFLLPGLPPPPAEHRKVTLTWFDGRMTLTAPVLSSSGFGEVGSVWSEQERAGREPLTVWAGPRLTRAQLEITVFDSIDPQRDIESTILLPLTGLARNASPVLVVLGSMNRWSSTGMWVVETMATTVTRRQQGTNRVCEATVALELKTAATPQLVLGQ